MSYLNSNGLEDGNIPAGQPCPFWESCKMRTDNCPSQSQPKPRAFSCALARLNSMIKKEDLGPCSLLVKVRDGLGSKT